MNPETANEPEPTLKNLIEAAGTTQRQLSRDTGIAEVTINTWVAGRKVPRFDNAIVLARELGVSLKALARAMHIDISGIPDDVLPPRSRNKGGEVENGKRSRNQGGEGENQH